jgi:prepilin-type N-terminal cleavage/methylation domain-containing protein
MRQDFGQRRGHERGFSLIELMIVIAIIGILVGVGIPAWQSSVRSANQAAAIRTLNAIQVEQRTYFNSHNRTSYGTFDQLIADGALNKNFAGEAPEVEGYIFKMVVTPKGAGQPPMYRVNADPQKADGFNATGKQFYYMDSNSSTIHVNGSQPAGPDDPPLGGTGESGGGGETK